MAGVRVIFAREFSAYFDSPIAYVCAAVFLALSGSIFMNRFFLDGVVDMSPYFKTLPFLLVPFIPALTMRVWAEEKAHRTFELLMTLPFKPSQVVAGKYLASFCFYLIVLAGSLPIVAMLIWLGKPDLGLIFASYLGAVLLGAFFLAFGVFVSGLTQDQIVAFVLGTLLGFVFVFSGQPRVVDVLDGLAPGWQIGTHLYESVSIVPHYEAFCRGIVPLSGAFYFAAMSAFFLWMNAVSLQHSKY